MGAFSLKDTFLQNLRHVDPWLGLKAVGFRRKTSQIALGFTIGPNIHLARA